MDLKRIAVVILLACSSRSTAPPPTPTAVARSLAAVCVPARDHGAIPDDGLDDRAALQLALDSGCVQLEAGQYDVDTPPTPRTRHILNAPAGAKVFGVGADRTTIAYRGATNGYDWRGIQFTAGFEIHDLRLTNEAVVATVPNEQVPLMRMDGDGATATVDIHHLRMANPTIGGDCVHFVGYDPIAWKPSTLYAKTNRIHNAGRSYETTVAGTSATEGGPTGTGAAIVDGTATWKFIGEGVAVIDRRIWNVTVRDSIFEACSRSGIAIHSGMHHCSIRDNQFLDTWDQDIDGESGGNKGLDDCEIADNLFLLGPHAQSAAAVAPQDWSNARIHHNVFDGRAMEVFGCEGCEFHHNVIKNQIAGKDRVPLHGKKNFINVEIHHEHYTHNDIGASAVLKLEQIGSVGPSNVTIRDSTFIQNAPTTAIASVGTRGLHFSHNTVIYNGAVSRMAMDVQPSVGTTGVQTTDVDVRHSTFKSTVAPWQAILHLNGSGHGTGSFEVSDTWASTATRGVWCENVNATIGIQGPATYYGNIMPAPICGVLPMGGN